MAVDDENDALTLLIATPVYASKNLNVDDLEFDQECTYRKLPGNYHKAGTFNFRIEIVVQIITHIVQTSEESHYFETPN